MPALGRAVVTVTADPVTVLRDQPGVLGAAKAIWENRADVTGTAAERRAASDAIGAVDAMLRQLYLVRGRLVAEVRKADDAAAARADDLLRRGGD